MRRAIVGILVVEMLCAMLLTGCGCEHEWKEADCYLPKTCMLCGEREGEKLDHVWQEATCEMPKHCANCEVTEGEALQHTWTDATCSQPKICQHCGATEGAAMEHDWIEATYTMPKTCGRCGATEGGVKQVHNGKTFTMTVEEFDDKFNSELKFYNYLSLIQTAVDLSSILGDAPKDTRAYSLFGTYMDITYYQDPETKMLKRIVFSIDESVAEKNKEAIAENLNDYLTYGMIAYAVANPKTDFVQASELYMAAEAEKVNGKECHTFTSEGVTFKATIGYLFFEMDIYIEE